MLTIEDILGLDGRPADQRIVYGNDGEQFIELWTPSNTNDKPVPVIVLIHGGCWLAKHDISHIRPLAAKIADRGYAVWAVEYRRLDQAGGGWPGSFLDVAAAIDLIPGFQDPLLDKNRVVLLGHSAGGLMAAWAAGRSRLAAGQALYRENPFEPVGAIGLAAITDLGDYITGSSLCEQSALRLMEGTPEEHPERYAQASPALLGSDIPLVLIHGDADEIVPLRHASAVPGAPANILAGSGHFDLIHTDTPAFSSVMATIEERLAA
ncbi:MAG: alpha/beta hydrolase [Lysobacterales bacterium]|jgi:acetyl esterase/lipase